MVKQVMPSSRRSDKEWDAAVAAATLVKGADIFASDVSLLFASGCNWCVSEFRNNFVAGRSPELTDRDWHVDLVGDARSRERQGLLTSNTTSSLRSYRDAAAASALPLQGTRAHNSRNSLRSVEVRNPFENPTLMALALHKPTLWCAFVVDLLVANREGKRKRRTLTIAETARKTQDWKQRARQERASRQTSEPEAPGGNVWSASEP